MKLHHIAPCLFIALISFSCSKSSSVPAKDSSDSGTVSSAGLTLPDGFKAIKVADEVGSARHIAIAENGDMYVTLHHSKNGGGIVALRDTDGDGKADIKKYFGKRAGTGIGLHNGYLYMSSNNEVVRFKMREGELVPKTPAELMISGFERQNQHADKAFTFDDSGHIYVNVGAPSNSCQEKDRTKESPGQDPCPLLERHAGIWRFNADQPGQTQQKDGYRYVTGTRNVVGLDWNKQDNTLYIMQHGRDQLYQNWPNYFTKEQSAELPAEELFKANDGDNFGWPYSYYDQNKKEIMLNPEYGGDGKKTIADSKYKGQFEPPIVAFPGHWAPNGLVFYTGNEFPAKYQGGAFIAFHGSWNRAPEPQAGYRVDFVPFKNGKASSDYEDFATGFPGTDNPQPGSAKHRPCGVTVGPNGALYVADSSGGTIYRITYAGD